MDGRAGKYSGELFDRGGAWFEDDLLCERLGSAKITPDCGLGPCEYIDFIQMDLVIHSNFNGQNPNSDKTRLTVVAPERAPRRVCVRVLQERAR